jgi:sugar phosphate isomerase/epimerase
MQNPHRITRRRWIEATGKGVAVVGAGNILSGTEGFARLAAESPLPPVAAFSKVYQELKLDFEQSAELTAAAGLEGIDCPVRPGGEILPEHAADRMPQYAEALAKRRVHMLLLTTAIQGVDSPHARAILSTGRKLGIRYYRLGFWSHRPDVPAEKLAARIRAGLKELAAMNREMGLCALFQNHSSGGDQASGLAGGDLSELYEIVKDFDPNQIAVAFDLGHALITHGDQWRTHFQRLKRHVRIVYVKDVQRPSRFVPFGQGEFGQTGFFRLLAQMNYRAPLSVHIEYDWASPRQKSRAVLAETLKHSRRALRQWWTGGNAEAPAVQ